MYYFYFLCTPTPSCSFYTWPFLRFWHYAEVCINLKPKHMLASRWVRQLRQLAHLVRAGWLPDESRNTILPSFGSNSIGGLRFDSNRQPLYPTMCKKIWSYTTWTKNVWNVLGIYCFSLSNFNSSIVTHWSEYIRCASWFIFHLWSLSVKYDGWSSTSNPYWSRK